MERGGGGRGVQGYERCVCGGVLEGREIRCWEGGVRGYNVGGVLEGGGMKGCRGIWEVCVWGGGDEGRGIRCWGRDIKGCVGWGGSVEGGREGGGVEGVSGDMGGGGGIKCWGRGVKGY